MMFWPAGRFFTLPCPPGVLEARCFAAVILPPRLFFAILFASFLCYETHYHFLFLYNYRVVVVVVVVVILVTTGEYSVM